MTVSNFRFKGDTLKKMVATSWRFAKELLLFCSVGALIGAGIGFIMFLHLGAPKTPEDAGYVAGLFVKSGVQLGFIFWMIRVAVRPLRRWFFGSPTIMS
jgi:hypothetical protein